MFNVSEMVMIADAVKRENELWWGVKVWLSGQYSFDIFSYQKNLYTHFTKQKNKYSTCKDIELLLIFQKITLF